MNICEVESATGLTRANIRYYESEGLFTPERKKNGYRDYTKEDVETLKRIKLLRKLNVPIEEIIQLQKDQASLTMVIEERLAKLELETQDIRNQQRICRKLKNDGAAYHNLDADHYLQQWNESDDILNMDDRLAEIDQNPPVYCVWRRIFARLLDQLFYACVISFLIYLIFHPFPKIMIYVIYGSLLTAWIPMLLVEPLFLHYLETTPCKFLLGLRIRNIDGSRLTLDEAKTRTKRVLYYCIFTSKYRYFERFHDAENGVIPWESMDETEADEYKGKHFFGGMAVVLLMCLASYFLMVNAQFPVNRGNLSKAELAANYNRYAGSDALMNLDEDCQWRDVSPYGSVVFNIGAEMPDPQLEIEEINGYISGISFEVRVYGQNGHGYQGLIKKLMWSYGGAQRGMSLSEMEKMIELIDQSPPRSFSAEIEGMQIDYNVSCGGYSPLYLEPNAEGFIEVSFRMKKTN